MAKTKEKERETQLTTKEEAHIVTKGDVGHLPSTVVNGGQVPSVLQAAPMSEAAQLFLKEAKGERKVPTKIPLIKIDHAGALFVLPTGECVESVSGYPVYYYQNRSYWKKPPQPGAKGTPPDCSSADMIMPSSQSLEKQAATCAQCKMSEFGSGRDGKSQACGVKTWVFLLNPEFGSPPIGVIVAPPSSIRELLGSRFSQGYFGMAAAKHRVHEIVWSTFRLEKAGDLHCVVKGEMGAVAPVSEVPGIVGIRNDFLAIMDAMKGDVEMAVSAE